MEQLMREAQSTFKYTDCEIARIRYVLTAMFYDISKLIILAFFFYCTGHIIHFAFAIVPLILLRTKLGGLHFQSYISCFIFSLLYLYSAIYVLPTLFTLHPLAIYIVLLSCTVICYYVGPNSLTRKTPKSPEYCRKAKFETFQLILIIAILIFIFSANEYLLVSFWTIVLHTIQLSITKIIKEVKT